MTSLKNIHKGLEELFSGDDRPVNEVNRLIQLMSLFAELPEPVDSFGLFPRYAELKETFLSAIKTRNVDQVEERFLELYCHLHGYEAPYTEEERSQVNATGGYWCHAGGLSPILKAGDHITPETVSADYGAGNGLQALLFQKLYPHKKTVQIEISSRMVEAGKDLQRWLGIEENQVEWIVGDVASVPPTSMDFIYLYRPLKPEGKAGKVFYTSFAGQLEKVDRAVTIFSIADCLKEFLSGSFETFYTDGHLTCFRKK